MRLPRFGIARLIWGYVILNVMLLPLSGLLLLFIGIMAGASPNAGSPLVSFGVVAAFLYLAPAAAFAGQLAIAKTIDTLFLCVRPLVPEVTPIGLVVSGIALVVAGNVFVDDLYQWRQGNIGLSFLALGADGVAIAFIAASGQIRFRPVERLLARLETPR